MACPSKLIEESLILGKLDPAEQEHLSRTAIHHEFSKGQRIADLNEIWPYVILLEQGCINLMKMSSEGRSLILLILRPGEIFVGYSVYGSRPMPVSLVVAEDCSIYKWHQSDVLPLVLRNPAALWDVTNLLVERATRANELIEGLAFDQLSSRLARVLLDHFEGAKDGPVRRKMTLEEMAAMAGTTREMVCKMLHRFAEEGLIRVTRTEFYFTDPSGLQKLVDGDQWRL